MCDVFVKGALKSYTTLLAILIAATMSLSMDVNNTLHLTLLVL